MYISMCVCLCLFVCLQCACDFVVFFCGWFLLISFTFDFVYFRGIFNKLFAVVTLHTFLTHTYTHSRTMNDGDAAANVTAFSS